MTVFESLAGFAIPLQIYGTAWKRDQTADLVELALSRGFRGVDTACQPKHYQERLVGQGIQRSGIPRSELFIQTKFTPFAGQDPDDCPYDPRSPLKDQIERSLEVSLENLQTDDIDSLVLHSPLPTWEENLRSWRTLEGFVKDGRVKQLGISNCYDPDFFSHLFNEAEVKPSVVQNRFYEVTGYDRELRAYCNDRGIYYQCFWTVNANPHVWQDSSIIEIARRIGKSPLQVFFRALMQDQIHPLYGTTNAAHMEETMSLLSFSLEPEDLAQIRRVGGY
jgi:diketogulonate reductase-like aldo/keto reductase